MINVYLFDLDDTLVGTKIYRNTGALLPGKLGEEWSSASPAVTFEGIPYTFEWDGIRDVVEKVTSKDEAVVRELAENRARFRDDFGADGKASKRLADLMEEFQ